MNVSCILSNPPDYDTTDHSPVILDIYPRKAFNLVNITEDPDNLRNLPINTRFVVTVLEYDSQQLRFRWYRNFDRNKTDCNCKESSTYPPADEHQDDWNVEHAFLESKECYRITVVMTDGDWADGDELGCPDVEEGVNLISNDWWLLPFDELEDEDFEDGLPGSTSLSKCLDKAAPLGVGGEE